MPVSKHVSQDGRHVRIVVTDSFDERAIKAFRNAFIETAQTCRAYEVDLSGVTRMISAALGILIVLNQSARGIDASVKIINPSMPAKKNLELAFLHRILDICFI
jgi:anti-anti-sigma factor